MEFEYATDKQVYEFFSDYNGTEESVKRDVKLLKEWVKEQPHLPDVDDERWLTNILLRTKNDVENAKRKIDGYYTYRAVATDVFRDRDPSSPASKELIQSGLFLPLPKLTPRGYRVVVYSVLSDKVDMVPDEKCFLQMSQVLKDVDLKTNFTRAQILIVDCENTNTHVISVVSSLLPKLVAQYSISPLAPIRRIYVINMKQNIHGYFTMWRGLLHRDISDKITFWDADQKDLIKVLPKEVLPSIYGGEGPTLKEVRDICARIIKDNNDWIIADGETKADLLKRPKHYRYGNDSILNLRRLFKPVEMPEMRVPTMPANPGAPMGLMQVLEKLLPAPTAKK